MDIHSVEVEIEGIGLRQRAIESLQHISLFILDRVVDNSAPLPEGPLADHVNSLCAVNTFLQEILFEKEDAKLRQQLVFADLPLFIWDEASHQFNPDRVHCFFDQRELSIAELLVIRAQKFGLYSLA